MTKIEMCRFYSVRMFSSGGFRALCSKGRKAGLKCHSERRARGCPDYRPSDSVDAPPHSSPRPVNEVGQSTQHGN